MAVRRQEALMEEAKQWVVQEVLVGGGGDCGTYAPGGGGGSGFINSPYVTDGATSRATGGDDETGTPPESDDPIRSGSGQGGVPGGANGTNGRIYIYWE